jgi:hypothetical protein
MVQKNVSSALLISIKMRKEAALKNVRMGTSQKWLARSRCPICVEDVVKAVNCAIMREIVLIVLPDISMILRVVRDAMKVVRLAMERRETLARLAMSRESC